MRFFTADCGATNTSWAIYSETEKELDSGNLQGVNFFEGKEEGITKLLYQISELDLKNIDYIGFSIAGTGNAIHHTRAVNQIKKMRI